VRRATSRLDATAATFISTSKIAIDQADGSMPTPTSSDACGGTRISAVSTSRFAKSGAGQMRMLGTPSLPTRSSTIWTAYVRPARLHPGDGPRPHHRRLAVARGDGLEDHPRNGLQLGRNAGADLAQLAGGRRDLRWRRDRLRRRQHDARGVADGHRLAPREE